jgi:undecaprenyl diphosphate synthase
MARVFKRVPGHIGIIMDGNGRWARQRGLPRIEGHRRGAERARELLRLLPEYGVGNVTLYTFSLENWQRPEKEIKMLMSMLERYLKKDMYELQDEGVRFKAIGETWRLPQSTQDIIHKTEELTAGNERLTVVTALSYGGRNEIVRAASKAIASGMGPKDLTEESFAGLLDTAGISDPDLIIRTSGEIRLSNFLPWQTAYSEFYFTETLWPDFERTELEKALSEYEGRDRRFGAVEDKEEQGA